jgi:hypothetical protein
LVSHGTASPAIKISGTTAGTEQGTRLFGGGSLNWITIASTAATGGGIDIYGSSPAASSYDVAIMRNYLLSRNGAITISANVNYLQMDSGAAGNNYYGSISGSPYVSTSSANVTFLMNEFDFDDASHFFRTSGDLTILPKTGNVFGMDFTPAFSTNGIRNLIIGKDPLSADTLRAITLTGNHTVSGDIDVYGGHVYPRGNFAVTGQGEILLKALSDIATDDASRNFTTQGGDLTFWADSNAASGGSIYIAGSSSLQTNGGDITMAGGLDNGSSAVFGLRVAPTALQLVEAAWQTTTVC